MSDIIRHSHIERQTVLSEDARDPLHASLGRFRANLQEGSNGDWEVSVFNTSGEKHRFFKRVDSIEEAMWVAEVCLRKLSVAKP